MSKQGICPTWPHPLLREAFESGEYATNATEPWTQRLIAAWQTAIGAETVIEFGCHAGMTSAWLALELESQGGGKIICVDVNADYCKQTSKFLSQFPIPNVEVQVMNASAMEAIDALPRHSIDFAFVDFLVEGVEVQPVLEGLWSWWDPKGRQRMALGGVIACHDTTKPDVAQAVVGHHGKCFELKCMHPQGGLGIIQVPLR